MFGISVVIPTIGREGYLVKAITSLLDQTIAFNEIVVYDNSIAQNVPDIIAKNFCDDNNIILRQSGKQLKPVSSWNNAVKACSNEYILIFGDDDEALPNLNETIQKYIGKHHFVLVSFNRINEHGIIVNESCNNGIPTLNGCAFVKKRMDVAIDMVLPGFVFRKQDFEIAGGFVECHIPNYLYLDDVLWFKLALIADEVVFTKETGWNYRVHSTQIGNNVNLFEFNRKIKPYIKTLEAEFKKIKGNKFDIFKETGISRKEYANRLILMRYNVVNRKPGNLIKRGKAITAVLVSTLSIGNKVSFSKSILKTFLHR